jgi:glycerol-3-phosphate acyltransferase PlsY
MQKYELKMKKAIICRPGVPQRSARFLKPQARNAGMRASGRKNGPIRPFFMPKCPNMEIFAIFALTNHSETAMLLTIYTATTMIVLAYLLGSIPSAVWIGKKYYGIDIREHGSKNAGTTNMLRVLGRRAAAPVFALDFLKGFVAVTVIELLQYDELIGPNDIINLKIAAVVAAVLGHIFPIFAGFRGGKGVATLVGAVTGIYPPAILLCFGVWIVVLMISHYVSLSSMIAGCCFPVFTLISPKVNGSVPFVVFSFAIAVLLIVTHRKNIKRLREGTESKIYIWKPRSARSKEQSRDKKE